MPARVIVTTNPEALEPCANHFGVSVDNYLSSMPVIGMESIEIAHSGLVVVGSRTAYSSRQELRPRELFQGTYRKTAPISSIESEQSCNTVEAIIPEVVEDFCKKKNIPPITVAKVGARLLWFAVESGAGLGSDLSVYAKRNRSNRGVLDSKLSFSISAINTIVMERRMSNSVDKIKSRFGYR